MKVLVDTNIVARLAQPPHPQHRTTLRALDALKFRRDDVCIVPQVLYECWTVCTRPTGGNGLGLTTAQAQVEQAKARSLFALLTDNAAIFPEWQRLVSHHDVKGKSAHDARLVAAMAVHGLAHILTFNGTDFVRYPGISVIDPASVAASPPSP